MGSLWESEWLRKRPLPGMDNHAATEASRQYYESNASLPS